MTHREAGGMGGKVEEEKKVKPTLPKLLANL